MTLTLFSRLLTSALALPAPTYTQLASQEIATPASPQSTIQQSEIVIDEGQRPVRSWRTYGGICGGHRYEISISLGKALAHAVRDAKVDARSHGDTVRRALQPWASIKGVPVDAVIHQCEAKRARIRFDTLLLADPRRLHFYYLWLGSDGSVELLGER